MTNTGTETLITSERFLQFYNFIIH